MEPSYRSLLIRLANWTHGKSFWLPLALALLWIAAVFAVAHAYDVLSHLLADGDWRFVVLQPAIILYILFVGPWLERTQDAVAEALRPVVLVGDEEYAQVVVHYGQPSRRGELWAMAIGAAFPLLLEGPSLLNDEARGLVLMVLLASMAMYATMGMVIYGSVASTRLTRAIHALPMDVDLFDIRPFESVGRQSVVLVLAFVGGITLSLLLSFSWRTFLAWQNLVVYVVLVGVTVLVFFLNMRHTHRVLAAAKNGELAAVASAIGRTYRQLRLRRRDESAEIDLSELGAWLALEQRLRSARTWPYNTEMLRTVSVSVLIPLLVALARIVVVLLQGSRDLSP